MTLPFTGRGASPTHAVKLLHPQRPVPHHLETEPFAHHPDIFIHRRQVHTAAATVKLRARTTGHTSHCAVAAGRKIWSAYRTPDACPRIRMRSRSVNSASCVLSHRAAQPRSGSNVLCLDLGMVYDKGIWPEFASLRQSFGPPPASSIPNTTRWFSASAASICGAP